MALFKRTPRDFHIHIGTPWTINDEPTSAADPEAALKEIYDTAKFFPITITVTGPGINYALEMDEYMSTSILEETEEPEEPPVFSPPANEPDPTPSTPRNPALTRSRPSFTAIQSRMTFRRVGIGAAIVLTLCLIVSLFVLNRPETNAEAQAESWETTLPTPAPADSPISQLFPEQLWTLNPGEVKSAAAYAAGVLTTTDTHIQLRDHSTGEEIAAYKADPKTLQSVVEFQHGDTPAVGLRFAEKFVALSSESDTQEWSIPKDAEVTVYGTTPLVTNESTYKAIAIGEKTLIDLVPNPDLPVRAVDDKWIVQPQLGTAQVALNPVHREAEDASPHNVDLIPPKEGAVFTRHLDVGRGKALALWTIDDKPFVSTHALQGDSAGRALSTVPAPFDDGDPTSWTLSAGMKLALLGPYAFSLETGKLASYNPQEAFTKAYGEAAITVDANGKQTVTIGDTAYPADDQVIGTTPTTILVRLADGSVATYGKSGGKA